MKVRFLVSTEAQNVLWNVCTDNIISKEIIYIQLEKNTKYKHFSKNIVVCNLLLFREKKKKEPCNWTIWLVAHFYIYYLFVSSPSMKTL